MIRQIVMTLLATGLMAGAVNYAVAEPLTSANYRIPAAVLSTGGSPMGSTNYQLNFTVGQPSPLMNPADPPLSAGYDLLPGFWYTVGIEPLISNCPADFEPDGDVDDDDLSTLAAGFGLAVVGRDADGDLDMDGLDLYEMAVDFNRTDCFP